MRDGDASQHPLQWRVNALNTTGSVELDRLLLTLGCYLANSATN